MNRTYVHGTCEMLHLISKLEMQKAHVTKTKGPFVEDGLAWKSWHDSYHGW